MARMFPEVGPQNTGSTRAEPDVYWQLSKKLSDEFTVLHSLPWLASVAKEIDGRSVPTGEIDFLILHQSLGILAVEVKGGVLSYDRTEFVYKRTGNRLDPIRQVSRGTHALARWLCDSGAGKWRIGYCILLPHSEIQNKAIPVASIDRTVEPPQSIILDINDLDNLGERVKGVMSYWRNALETWPLQHSQIEKLVNIILPSSDYNPCWQTIIKNDTRTWLRLRPEQTNCLKRINKEDRLVVTGFPGTGKTLLLTEHARKLSKSGQKVLVITYNYLLSKQLQNELPDSGIEVRTFHEQCRRAARATGNSVPTHSSGQDSDQDWYSTDAPKVLRQGVSEKKLKDYDALIVDEGQAIHAEWWNILCEWFDKKRIIVFCDSTQSFSFENSTSSGDVATAIDAETPYVLTINLRSPRAVFDRVSEIKLAPYQQSCPRPLAVNTLTEIVVEDMQEALRQVVIQLRENDNVPPYSIVILDATPRSQKEERYAGIRVVSAAKFRGLESPVVIVWAGVGSDEASLFCAYTRATSRCIAIYDAIEVLKGNYQTFGEVVLGLDKVGNIKKEAQLGLTSGIVEKQRFSLTPAAEKTVRLSWCPDWDGWVIFPEKDKQIERAMWTHHLITTTCQPVYTWNVYDRNTLCYFEPISKINDSSGRHCDLDFCEYCNTLTPFASVFGEEIGECTVCIHRQNVLTPPGINIQSEFDQILSKGAQSSNSSKRKLSIFLIALGRWNSISEKRRKEFDNYLPVSGTVGYSVAHLLVLTDLLRRDNVTIELNETADRYRDGWCPDLTKRIDEKSWRGIVARGINTWITHKMLQKVGRGVYKKTDSFHQIIDSVKSQGS